MSGAASIAAKGSPLSFADLSVVQTCLDLGAKNDPHPSFGQTALQAAVAHCRLEIVDLILTEAAKSQVRRH
jgi:hypothetical protein